MPAIERVGDLNERDGPITGSNQGDVFANNILVAIDGSPVAGHYECEPPIVTTSGSPNVFAHGISVNRIGDSDSCGHSRVTGSPNVFVNS